MRLFSPASLLNRFHGRGGMSGDNQFECIALRNKASRLSFQKGLMLENTLRPCVTIAVLSEWAILNMSYIVDSAMWKLSCGQVNT